MEHRQGVRSPKKSVVTINAVGRVVGDRYEFGGFMSIDGQGICSVTGFLLGDFRTEPKRRRGRPKNEPLKVAIALHECMALSETHKTGESKRSARIRAARALSVGGDDDNAEKYIRTHAKHETVEAALSGYDRFLTCSGDAEGDGRLALALRHDVSLFVVGDELRLSGLAWVCNWGQRQALCSSIDGVLRTDVPHLLAALPSWAKGGA